MPPLFTADAEEPLGSGVTATLKAYAQTLDALFKPLEMLSPEELQAIGANQTVAAIGRAWESNTAVLRQLLLPLPRAVRALPAPPAANVSRRSRAACAGVPPPKSSTYTSGEMVIAHVARDWSSTAREWARARTHAPVLRAIDAIHRRHGRKQPLRILVPGAGAGRLAWELSTRGHRVEANDASSTMVLAARAMIASAAHPDAAAANAAFGRLRLYPHAGCGGGIGPRERCLHAYRLHGVRRRHGRAAAAAACGAAARLTLRIGDWCDDGNRDAHVLADDDEEESGGGGSSGGGGDYDAYDDDDDCTGRGFDAVVTSYFLDTLPNPAAAVREVRGMLKPGGAWVNVGPLLWHDAVRGMLRMSLDELRGLLRLHGFREEAMRPLGMVPYIQGQHGGYATAGASGGERHEVVFWAATV